MIDQTEALVAIDVNSGKMTKERDHEDTVYMTNFEAAQVIARQLRLRDLGGIIVIDFIDMELSRNQRAVEKAMKDETKTDRARIKMSRILSNGLCIVTRQRIRPGIQRSFQRRCNVCSGTGWIRTPESHSLSLLKRIETRLAQGEVEEVRVLTHKETAEHILNSKRSELLSLEREYHCRIMISVRQDMDRDADDVQYLSKGDLLQEITDKLPQREERRGGALRKRSRKKKRSEVEAGAPVAHERKPRGEKADRGEGEERSGKRRRGKKLREGKPAREEALEAVPPTADGVTFTGKPPPEVLERIKAEARARRQALEAKRAGGKSADAPPQDGAPQEVQPPAAQQQEPQAPPRSLFDSGGQDAPRRTPSSAPEAGASSDSGGEGERQSSLFGRFLGMRKAPPRSDSQGGSPAQDEDS